jgi:hypothetical protein
MFTSVGAGVINMEFKQRNFDRSCSKTWLHSPKCETEVRRAQASTRTQDGGGNWVRNFEFGASLPLAG